METFQKLCTIKTHGSISNHNGDNCHRIAMKLNDVLLLAIWYFSIAWINLQHCNYNTGEGGGGGGGAFEVFNSPINIEFWFGYLRSRYLQNHFTGELNMKLTLVLSILALLCVTYLDSHIIQPMRSAPLTGQFDQHRSENFECRLV